MLFCRLRLFFSYFYMVLSRYFILLPFFFEHQTKSKFPFFFFCFFCDCIVHNLQCTTMYVLSVLLRFFLLTWRMRKMTKQINVVAAWNKIRKNLKWVIQRHSLPFCHCIYPKKIPTTEKWRKKRKRNNTTKIRWTKK